MSDEPGRGKFIEEILHFLGHPARLKGTIASGQLIPCPIIPPVNTFWTRSVSTGRTGRLFLCHHFIPVPGRSTTANRATSASSKAIHLLFLRFGNFGLPRHMPDTGKSGILSSATSLKTSPGKASFQYCAKESCSVVIKDL